MDGDKYALPQYPCKQNSSNATRYELVSALTLKVIVLYTGRISKTLKLKLLLFTDI